LAANLRSLPLLSFSIGWNTATLRPAAPLLPTTCCRRLRRTF
jgi:hypothetical protein